MKKIFKLFAMLICIALMSFNSAWADTFNDLPPSHWAYEAVEYLYENGVVVGYPMAAIRLIITLQGLNFALWL